MPTTCDCAGPAVADRHMHEVSDEDSTDEADQALEDLAEMEKDMKRLLKLHKKCRTLLQKIQSNMTEFNFCHGCNTSAAAPARPSAAATGRPTPDSASGQQRPSYEHQ